MLTEEEEHLALNEASAAAIAICLLILRVIRLFENERGIFYKEQIIKPMIEYFIKLDVSSNQFYIKNAIKKISYNIFFTFL